MMLDPAEGHIATAGDRPTAGESPAAGDRPGAGTVAPARGQPEETRPLEDANPAAAQRRSPSTIRAMLMWAVMAWIVPAWVFFTIGIVIFYQREREYISQSTISTARALIAGVDRELTGKMAATQVLAMSPHLRSGDYAAFHREASALVPVLLGHNLILSDASGRQVVNTIRPYGEQLPLRSNLANIRKVFETGMPALSDSVFGSVSKIHMFVIDVPVVHGNDVKYSLALGISSKQLSDFLLEQRLAPNWVASIFDSSGVVVARTHGPERFVGHEGPPALLKAMMAARDGVAETVTLDSVPVISAFSRSEVSNWTVAISVPTAQLYGELQMLLLLGGIGALGLLGANIALAGYQSARISQAVKALIPPALALGRGEVPNISPLQVREADDVAQALDRAFHLLQSRTVERDDAQQEKHDAEVISRIMADAYRRVEVANKELEEFAYAASHDLKAPLRVIDNASKWLEEDLQEFLTDETRSNMDLLRGRVQRMERLLDDLLEYSRVGRTTDERYVETVTGEALMTNILALLSPPAGFTVTSSPNFAAIQVRRMPLQQVLMNLISNAIKHHDKKSGSIEVTVDDDGEFYAFAVKDDGPGISGQFHEQIFKMFQTLKPRDQVEGSGIGLALVRKNIAVFGGTLDLESAEGKGCTFRFTWPKHQPIKGKQE